VSTIPSRAESAAVPPIASPRPPHAATEQRLLEARRQRLVRELMNERRAAAAKEARGGRFERTG
jgi:hypothetical protein